MRRPEGFERPPAARPPAERAQDDVREVVRLDAIRKRTAVTDAVRPADEAGSAPAPRRWALSAYADLDTEGDDLDADAAGPPAHEAGARTGAHRAVDADSGTATAGRKAERAGASNAQRVDRAWRQAQREQRRLDREELRDTKREARLAKRARRRQERAEVRRFTAARRRQLRIALLTGGGLVLALGLLVGLVWSPLMAVRQVEVEGAERIDPAVVQEALADQVGEPIATVTEEGIATRLQTIPQVESFRVDVVPPSTVIVRLVERQPVAIVERDGSAVLIDAAGVVLGGADESTGALPRLEGVEIGTPEFEAVATMLVSVPVEVLESTATVQAPTPSDITLTLATGQTVQWGGADQSPLKADVLAALMATQDPAAAAVLDVRAPQHPVVTGGAG